MSAPVRRDRRFALAFGLALGGLALAALPAAAQTPALYALNKNGTLTLNATLLDSLPGSKWVSLVVDGSDRYALRDDGLVFKNGIKLYKLQCKTPGGDDVVEGDWIGITFNNGSLWAVSKLGYMAQDGVCVTQFDVGDFEMSTIFSGSTGVYSMTTNGNVFRDTTITAAFVWDAGPGVDGDGEGEVDNTEWRAGTVGPDGKPYAIRRDGKLIRGDPSSDGNPPPAGTVIAALPFQSAGSEQYSDVIFTEDGSWNVLRLNGEVYKEPGAITPLIELNDSGPNFVDLLPLPASKSSGTTDASFFALRSDGDLFRETGTASVFDLMKSGYGELVLSLSPPNLDNIKNSLPVVTKYTVQATTGEAVSFPILATDTDLASDSLVVTVDDTTLPEGAVFDDVARTITWDAPVLGSYKIKVEVSDGVGNPVKVTYAIKVKDPDTNDTKNLAPRVSKIKNVQGLVGIPLVLPILATDPDGDTITMSVDDTAEPFTLGATFDAVTNVFTWTDPTLADIGTYKVKFNVSDGTKTVVLTVQIKIVSSLLGF
jgi:hypothetical protein